MKSFDWFNRCLCRFYNFLWLFRRILGWNNGRMGDENLIQGCSLRASHIQTVCLVIYDLRLLHKYLRSLHGLISRFSSFDFYFSSLLHLLVFWAHDFWMMYAPAMITLNWFVDWSLILCHLVHVFPGIARAFLGLFLIVTVKFVEHEVINLVDLFRVFERVLHYRLLLISCHRFGFRGWLGASFTLSLANSRSLNLSLR